MPRSKLPEDETGIEHEVEPEEVYDEAEEEDTGPSKRPAVKITGEKTGWMKMLKASKGFGRVTLGKQAWNEKWFVLVGGKFSIQPGPAATEKKKQTIDLTHALAFEKDPGDDADTFTLVTKSKTFFFKTRSAKDCVAWVENLQKAKTNYLGSFSSGAKESNSSMLF